MSVATLEEKNAARLMLARSCIEARNLAAADILCRNVLDHEPRDRHALLLLGVVAARLHDHQRACEFFQASLEAGEPSAADSLRRARQAAAAQPPATAGPRFLVIRSWGQGFWSDVTHVLAGLVLAEVTGRIPVVWWGSRSRFAGRPGTNAFAAFFQPVSSIAVDDVLQEPDATFFPHAWNAVNLLADWPSLPDRFDQRYGAVYLLGRPERVVVADFYLSAAELAPWIPAGHALAARSPADLLRHAVARHLRPVHRVVDAVEAFIADRFAGSRFVAAHVRGSDKAKELVGLDRAAETVFARLDATAGDLPIFLMTDDQRVADRAVSRYGRRLILGDGQRTADDIGLHFRDRSDGVRLGFEVMRDVYTALRADRFVGMGASNPSVMVSLMRPWAPGTCELVGRSILFRRSAFLYLPRRFAELAQPDQVSNP